MDILSAVNQWMINIEDAVFSTWPTTPDQWKLSTIVDGLHASFPAAPWYVLVPFCQFLAVWLPILVVVKVWKLAKW